jgi:hypothetical protein
MGFVELGIFEERREDSGIVFVKQRRDLFRRRSAYAF